MCGLDPSRLERAVLDLLPAPTSLELAVLMFNLAPNRVEGAVLDLLPDTDEFRTRHSVVWPGPA